MGRGREPRPAKSLNSFAAPGARVLGPIAFGPAGRAIAPSGVSPAQNRLPSYDPSKHQPLETDMINNATFQIIGRIGKSQSHQTVRSKTRTATGTLKPAGTMSPSSTKPFASVSPMRKLAGKATRSSSKVAFSRTHTKKMASGSIRPTSSPRTSTSSPSPKTANDRNQKAANWPPSLPHETEDEGQTYDLSAITRTCRT